MCIYIYAHLKKKYIYIYIYIGFRLWLRFRVSGLQDLGRKVLGLGFEKGGGREGSALLGSFISLVACSFSV